MQAAPTAETKLLKATVELLINVHPMDLRHRFSLFITDYLVHEIVICYPVWFVNFVPQIHAFQKWLSDVQELGYYDFNQCPEDEDIFREATFFLFQTAPPVIFSRNLRTMLLQYLELTATDVQKTQQKEIITDCILLFDWLNVAEETFHLIPLAPLNPEPTKYDIMKAIPVHPLNAKVSSRDHQSKKPAKSSNKATPAAQ